MKKLLNLTVIIVLALIVWFCLHRLADAYEYEKEEVNRAWIGADRDGVAVVKISATMSEAEFDKMISDTFIDNDAVDVKANIPIMQAAPTDLAFDQFKQDYLYCLHDSRSKTPFAIFKSKNEALRYMAIISGMIQVEEYPEEYPELTIRIAPTNVVKDLFVNSNLKEMQCIFWNSEIIAIYPTESLGQMYCDFLQIMEGPTSIDKYTDESDYYKGN